MDWFKSYLSVHSQCVKIGSILSDMKKFLFGVPQGSVLSSILFFLYTTPLSRVIQNHPCVDIHYMQTICSYMPISHIRMWLMPFDRLKSCLNDVKKWLSANNLKLNPAKTEFIILGSKSQCEKLNKSFPDNILGNLLSPVRLVRNLGVWLHNDSCFSRHVQNICKSCFVQIWDHLRGYLTHHAALMAANALV